MGVNDAREQLESAIQECIRLEREILKLTDEVARLREPEPAAPSLVTVKTVGQGLMSARLFHAGQTWVVASAGKFVPDGSSHTYMHAVLAAAVDQKDAPLSGRGVGIYGGWT